MPLKRLADALIGAGFGGSPGMVVGQVPDGWPSALVPDPPVTVLGGLQGEPGMSAVFEYPVGFERPLAHYCSLLTGAGWTLPQDRLGDGFESVAHAMLVRDDMFVHVRATSQATSGGTLLVSMGRGGVHLHGPDDQIVLNRA